MLLSATLSSACSPPPRLLHHFLRIECKLVKTLIRTYYKMEPCLEKEMVHHHKRGGGGGGGGGSLNVSWERWWVGLLEVCVWRVGGFFCGRDEKI